MKKLLTIAAVLIGMAGAAFNTNSKAPRYFVGEANINTGSDYWQIVRVIRAKDFKEADLLFRTFVRTNTKCCKGTILPKTNTVFGKNGSTVYSLWEIDFDNVLTNDK